MKKFDFHLHFNQDSGPDMDDYVSTMDAHGVSGGLVHAYPGDLWSERPSSGQTDEAVLAACCKHPGRLYGSVYLDLRESRERNIQKIEHYAAAGFKCVKMFPNLGFDPNDEIYEPVWDTVEKLGLACLSHCGWLAPSETNPKMRISTLTASPFHFEVPARRHPGINFIFAHFGGGATYLETITLCERLPNCFADCTPGWGRWVWAHRMPGVEDFPMAQFLYGTDNYPAGDYTQDERWWTELLTGLGRTPEEIGLFFYGNAAKILGLAPAE
jgi:predicted TIM-barrel fold metal-dependent hydrolase